MSGNTHDAVSDVELEREEYRRKQSMRFVLTSIVSTLVFVAVVAVGLATTPRAGRE